MVMDSNTSKTIESIRNADKALGFCLSNRFNKAKDFLAPLDGNVMYHAISKGTISFLQAILTYEPDLISSAYDQVKEASQLCDRNRKKYTWGEALQRFVSQPSYHEFTEEELHAELCYAECLLEWALLTFIQDENLISFIKGGLKIKHAYDIYKNCMAVLEEQPKSLKASHNRVDFESGVYMGVGTFNLLLSLLPTRVMRLLEWVGFSGDKIQGLTWLDKGYTLDGLRSPMCCVALLGYHIVASPLLGIGDTDVPYVESILSVYLKKFPESSIFLFFSGRLKQIQGLLDKALNEYEKSVSGNIDWQQVHHICYWEMMWCHSFKGEWTKAAEYAEKLSVESKWSKASYNYIQASFHIMELFEIRSFRKDENTQEEEDALNEKIADLLRNVVKHKQRIAGKSLPFEKFACCRVEKFNATGTLVLPALELIHVWNGFPVFANHTSTLEHFLKLTDIALKELEQKTDKSKHAHDNISLCYMIKGICLRYLKRTDEAETCLKKVASSPSSQHSSKMDYYIPPYAAAELAFMYRDTNDPKKSLKQLQHHLKHYSKYGLESRLHFRVHSGIEVLKGELAKRSQIPRDVSEDFENISIHNKNLNGQPSPKRTSGDTDIGHCSKELPNEDAQISVNVVVEPRKSVSPTTSAVESAPSSNEATPFHTPCTSPTMSEAASSISPKHSFKFAKNTPLLSKETSI